MNSVLKTFLAHVVAAGNRFIPKRPGLVLSGFPDVEDQLVAVLRWLESERSDLPVALLVSGPVAPARNKLRLLLGAAAEALPIYRKSNWRGVWAYWRASHVFFTHGLYGVRPVTGRQCVVNLWHGMPLKRMWTGRPNSTPPPCTWLLSTSPKYSEVLAHAAAFPVEKVPVLGLPRNDLLFSKTAATALFAATVKHGADRVLLFLPTYRNSKIGFITQDGQETDHVLGMPEDEVAALRKYLADTKTRMLVKPHPMSVHYGRNDLGDPWLWIISDAWLHEQSVTLYEALGQLDGMITDISSIYVDFLMLDRPVFFYFPDIPTYRKTRQFQLEPVEDWLGGPLCTTGSSLIDELRRSAKGEDAYRAQRTRLAALFNPQTGPDATERLFSFLGLPGGKVTPKSDPVPGSARSP